MDNNLNLDKLNNLSPSERAYALQILQELSENGTSKMYEDLLLSDYKEIPVDIDTFLHDPTYLGKGLITEEGKFTVFPYWVDMLKKLFPTNVDTSYNTLILSGAIGLGKSFVAVIAMCYMLYRMLCLKNPYVHYGLQEIDHITFSFMNITMDAAKGVAWSKFQELVQLSPWFMAHGRVSKSLNPEWQPVIDKGQIELLYGSQPRHVIGRAVFCSFEDEISFQMNQDIVKQREKAKQLISSIDARMSSRFMKGEKLPTLHLIASSKRTDQSFLETYIDMKKRNESKTTLIIDEPQWVIRTDKDSPKKFAVAVGNRYLSSEVLPLTAGEVEYATYRDKGYSILMVPFGYYEQFLDDIDIALTDIAGISTSNSSRFISGERWAKLKNPNISNPFTQEILTVGNGTDDEAQYYNFFDITKIPRELKSKPLYIHLDMSVSGDKTGIAGVWIRGKRAGNPDNPQKELYYQLAFAVSIKAPKGHQISFEKNRQFIYWLKQQGFNVKGISTDTYQSYDTGQTLKAHGFNYDVLSVDRVNSDHVCLPYQHFKSVIFEERLSVFPTSQLTEEIVGLIKDSNGKIDHTAAGGSINSKDISDAVCGALYNASQYAEEFAYDFGEDLNDITSVNGAHSNEEQQLKEEFEAELNKFFGGSSKLPPQQGLDFGFGAATTNYSLAYCGDGIIVW